MRLRFLLLLAFVPLASLPAQAFVQVLGNGRAHECYLAAKAGSDADAALRLCDQALRDEALNRRDRAATFVNRGVIRIAKDQVDEAMADYAAGIALAPDLGDAYVNRGVALIRLQRYDSALADIDKGIALGSSPPHLGYYDRALVEERMGRYREAYYDFKHVLELAPDFQPAADELKYYSVVKTPDPG